MSFKRKPWHSSHAGRINFDWFPCRDCGKYTLKWYASIARCKCGYEVKNAARIDAKMRKQKPYYPPAIVGVTIRWS